MATARSEKVRLSGGVKIFMDATFLVSYSLPSCVGRPFLFFWTEITLQKGIKQREKAPFEKKSEFHGHSQTGIATFEQAERISWPFKLLV